MKNAAGSAARFSTKYARSGLAVRAGPENGLVSPGSRSSGMAESAKIFSHAKLASGTCLAASASALLNHRIPLRTTQSTLRQLMSDWVRETIKC